MLEFSILGLNPESWKKKLNAAIFPTIFVLSWKTKKIPEPENLTPASQRWKIPTFYFFIFLKPSLI